MTKLNKIYYICLIIIFSFILRNLNNEIYVFDGTDIPHHILASLRLSSTYFFNLEWIGENFFAQVLQFSHGYTGLIINWFIFEFLFNFINIPINEKNFTVIASCFSMIGVVSIYLMFKNFLSKKNSKQLLYFLIICNIPIFVAHSRVFAGYIVLSLTLFCLSIYFLNDLLKNKQSKNKKFYFISLFLYIGSNNAFFLGLLFHLFYIFTYQNNLIYKINFKNKMSLFYFDIKKIYFNFYSIICIFFPILGYLLVTYFLVQNNINKGYLLRLFDKGESFNFNFLENTIYLLNYFGPFLILILFFFIKKINLLKSYYKKISLLDLYFILYFLVYFILITLSKSDSTYLLFLIIPVSYFFIKIIKKTNVLFIFMIFLINIFFTYSFVYKNFIFETFFLNKQLTERYTPGINHKIDYDNGFKTLGYFVRKNLVNVSRVNTPKKGFSSNIYTLGIVSRLDGAEYYLGDKYEVQDSENFDMLNKYKHYLLLEIPSSKATPNYVVTPQYPEQFNDIILRAVSKKNLKLLLTICKNKKVLMRVYGNDKKNIYSNKCIDAKKYNEKFNNEYNKIKDFSKSYLGQF